MKREVEHEVCNAGQVDQSKKFISSKLLLVDDKICDQAS